MLLDKRRASLAATAVLAMSMLAGCAVPGQGDPGTAAEWGDVTVTLSDVQEYSDGLLDLGFDTAPAEVGLTLAVIDDAVVGEAADLGEAWSDDEISADAEEWFSVLEIEGEVTPEAIEVARVAKALSVLAASEDGVAFLNEMSADIESDSTSSPRFGDFSADYFMAYLSSAASGVSQYIETYGDSIYVLFAGVSGYEDASTDPTWLGSPEPSASAEASTTATPEPSASASE